MPISDQAKDVVKNCYTVCLLFNRWFTSVILNKSTVSGEEFLAPMYVEKARIFRSNLTMFRQF